MKFFKNYREEEDSKYPAQKSQLYWSYSKNKLPFP